MLSLNIKHFLKTFLLKTSIIMQVNRENCFSKWLLIDVGTKYQMSKWFFLILKQSLKYTFNNNNRKINNLLISASNKALHNKCVRLLSSSMLNDIWSTRKRLWNSFDKIFEIQHSNKSPVEANWRKMSFFYTYRYKKGSRRLKAHLETRKKNNLRKRSFQKLNFGYCLDNSSICAISANGRLTTHICIYSKSQSNSGIM